MDTKKLLIVIVNLLAVASLSVYNIFDNNIWAMVMIANVAFSFADYPSYNWGVAVKWCGDSDPNNNLYEPYRVIQYVLGIALAVQLFIYVGWVAVLAFAVWHFTFNNDNLFYLWHYIFNFWGQDRKAFKNEILGDQCSWSFFAPVGIYYWIKTGHTNTIIKGSIICFQSFIGILLTILIISLW